MGRCYRDGVGVEQDYEQAVAWFRRTADLGNAEAMLTLGHFNEHGRGVGRDPTEARHLYARAIVQGNPAAVHALERLARGTQRGTSPPNATSPLPAAATAPARQRHRIAYLDSHSGMAACTSTRHRR